MIQDRNGDKYTTRRATGSVWKTKEDLRLPQRQLVNNEKFNVWAPWGRLLLDW